MTLLLVLALISVSLAITAIARYPLPASIFSRVILVSWFIGVIILIVMLGWGLWSASQAQGTHIPHSPHIGS